MDNQALFNLCFADFSINDWGFGGKIIGIKIPGTITDKYCFTGFGKGWDLSPLLCWFNSNFTTYIRN
jgi:hypothetical protein